MRRRQFVLTAPAGVLAACGGDPLTTGPGGDQGDLKVLHPALELEHTAAALYGVGLGVAAKRRALLEQIREHEVAHADAIREAIVDLRGRPGRAKPQAAYAGGFPRLRDERAFMAFALDFERRAAEAYAAALPRLKTPRLRSTLASILAVEAEHASLLGDDPLERVLPL